MTEYTAEEWLPSQSGLGESLLYRGADGVFFFVDIQRRLVHTVPAAQGWEARHTMRISELNGGRITRLHVVAGRTDVLAVQTRLGFALLDPVRGTFEKIAEVRHAEDADLDQNVRMNDGGIDGRGRWWAGTMALDEQSEIGRPWCLDDGEPMDASAGERSTVLNGPVWSPDDKIMYVSDTPAGKNHQYDYDIETGAATNPRVFAQLEDGGLPDGMAVDREGRIWVAANSRGKVIRYSPAGRAVAVVSVPGAKMTSCPTFGGNDMKTLFITSIAGEDSTGNVYKVLR